MKKISIVTVASIIFLILSSIVAYFLKYVFDYNTNPLLCLGLGIILLIISGIVVALIRNNTRVNIVCFIYNAIALGLCIRSWYIFRNFDNELYVMILVSLATIVYLWIFYWLSNISIIRNHFKLFFWIFLILSLCGYFAVVLSTITSYVSTFGFYMIIEIAFIYAMCVKSDKKEELIRNLTISTYSVFIVAILIAVIMISGEGDFDFDVAADISAPDAPNNKRVSK